MYGGERVGIAACPVCDRVFRPRTESVDARACLRQHIRQLAQNGCDQHLELHASNYLNPHAPHGSSTLFPLPFGLTPEQTAAARAEREAVRAAARLQEEEKRAARKLARELYSLAQGGHDLGRLADLLDLDYSVVVSEDQKKKACGSLLHRYYRHLLEVQEVAEEAEKQAQEQAEDVEDDEELDHLEEQHETATAVDCYNAHNDNSKKRNSTNSRIVNTAGDTGSSLGASNSTTTAAASTPSTEASAGSPLEDEHHHQRLASPNEEVDHRGTSTSTNSTTSNSSLAIARAANRSSAISTIGARNVDADESEPAAAVATTTVNVNANGKKLVKNRNDCYSSLLDANRKHRKILNLNAGGEDGYTPLMTACENGKTSVVKLLLWTLADEEAEAESLQPHTDRLLVKKDEIKEYSQRKSLVGRVRGCTDREPARSVETGTAFARVAAVPAQLGFLPTASSGNNSCSAQEEQLLALEQAEPGMHLQVRVVPSEFHHWGTSFEERRFVDYTFCRNTPKEQPVEDPKRRPDDKKLQLHLANAYGQTALSLAATKGHKQIVQMLLKTFSEQTTANKLLPTMEQKNTRPVQKHPVEKKCFSFFETGNPAEEARKVGHSEIADLIAEAATGWQKKYFELAQKDWTNLPEKTYDSLVDRCVAFCAKTMGVHVRPVNHGAGDQPLAGGAPLCFLCFTEEVNAALVPCFHCKTCYACAQELLRRNEPCPFCRVACTSVQRMYL
ncbi:unnamed protein product [Amoebophrya sp. A120]|nr:unnamed protein product [Amoebophrya sp. A120]|eukprot:GSA120T00008210001.1